MLIRRRFLQSSVAAIGAAALPFDVSCRADTKASEQSPAMRFGFVTYLWGADWDLATLLKNCESAQIAGVELRTGHAHGVGPDLSAPARTDVRKRFAHSRVTLVGIGSDEHFHQVDQSEVRRAIERTKSLIRLSHDVGGAGVKVQPNDLPAEVPREKTIEQIGRSLNEIARYADGLNQDVRLEVHGQCSPLPVMNAVLHVANHPRVGICWNSNPQDFEGKGLDHNFHLVKNRLGKTVHVRQLDNSNYPYRHLFQLLKEVQYDGWILLEAFNEVADRVAAIAEQQRIFRELTL